MVNVQKSRRYALGNSIIDFSLLGRLPHASGNVYTQHVYHFLIAQCELFSSRISKTMIALLLFMQCR